MEDYGDDPFESISDEDFFEGKKSLGIFRHENYLFKMIINSVKLQKQNLPWVKITIFELENESVRLIRVIYLDLVVDDTGFCLTFRNRNVPGKFQIFRHKSKYLSR